MPRPLADSDSELEENGAGATPRLLNTQTTLRQRKSRSPAKSDGSDANGAVEVEAGPSTTSTLKATIDSDNEEDHDEEDGDDEDEDEEVYIVERLLRHAFGEGDVPLYEVKWKGYPSSENTWEPEENLDGARDLLEVYFNRIGGHPSEVGEVAPAPKKRGRKPNAASGTPPPKKSKGDPSRASARRKGGAAKGGDADEEDIKWPDVKVDSDWVPPKPRKDAWEDILLEVQTLQADDDGTKWAFVLWSVEDEHGKKRTSKVLLSTASTAAPQKLIQFYEKHLVFTKSNE